MFTYDAHNAAGAWTLSHCMDLYQRLVDIGFTEEVDTFGERGMHWQQIFDTGVLIVRIPGMSNDAWEADLRRNCNEYKSEPQTVWVIDFDGDVPLDVIMATVVAAMLAPYDTNRKDQHNC